MKKRLVLLLLTSMLFSFGQNQFVLFFDSGKATLSVPEKNHLKSWILSNRESKIVAINGYTDEDGSSSYNDSLSKKRVDFIYNNVKDAVLIRADFQSRSFGENFNQAKSKSENRKVIVYFIEKKDLNRENEILGISDIKKETVVKLPRVFSEKFEMVNPTDGQTIKMELNQAFMHAIDTAKAGEKLVLENLNFVVNTFIVTTNSRPKMFELLTVLQQNPKLKIEIQGNLCCQPIDRLNLSTERAKAIYNFLVFYKIDKSRLRYKGFGSSNPLFALPEKSEEERAANRRVEILILENE